MISSESRDAGNPHVRFDERGEETQLSGKVSEAPTEGESRRNTPKTATASWLRSTRLSSTLQQVINSEFGVWHYICSILAGTGPFHNQLAHPAR